MKSFLVRTEPKKMCRVAKVQKQSPGTIILNRCSAALYQIYKKTPMRKCNFKKVALQGNSSFSIFSQV